jgi:hypothetical protein
MRSGLLCTAAVLACAGCGGNGLYPVSGKVTYQGEPAAGAVVHFRRAGADPVNEHAVMGIVQPDGSFALVCGHLGSGAPPGEYDVLIEWKRVTGQGKGGPQHGPDRLKGRYADPRRPMLQAVVRAERNVLPQFELTDARADRKR